MARSGSSAGRGGVSGGHAQGYRAARTGGAPRRGGGRASPTQGASRCSVAGSGLVGPRVRRSRRSSGRGPRGTAARPESARRNSVIDERTLAASTGPRICSAVRPSTDSTAAAHSRSRGAQDRVREVGARLVQRADGVVAGQLAVAQPGDLREDEPDPVPGLATGAELAQGAVDDVAAARRRSARGPQAHGRIVAPRVSAGVSVAAAPPGRRRPRAPPGARPRPAP